MEHFNGILQQDFNKIYSEVINCKIIAPPYSVGRVPHTFYLDKRAPFHEYYDHGYDEIYDIMKEGNDFYEIGKVGNNIVVKKNGNELYSQAHSSDRNYKFIYGGGVKGTKLTSGTGMQSGINGLEIYLSDSSANWTANQYLGKYAYVYSATTGYGEVFKILSNTSNQLIINGHQSDITAGKYHIFESFGDILYFIGADGFYGIHGSTVVKAEGFSEVYDITFGHDRFFFIDKNHNIYKSRLGYQLLFIDSTSYVTTLEGVLSIVSFNDYILLLSSQSIGGLKKEKIVVSGKEEEAFTYSNITREFGIFSANSYSVYNHGLYLLDSNSTFVSVSITPISDNKFIVDVSDEGVYIQKFLDNIPSGDGISISIDSKEIRIIQSGLSSSYLYIYDRLYKGWHMWKTEVKINKRYSRSGLYYGDKVYQLGKNNYIDGDNKGYTQEISIIYGEENMGSFKQVIFQKLILGTLTSEDAKIGYEIISGSDSVKFHKFLSGSKILKEGGMLVAAKGGALGQVILGLGLLGDNYESLQALYPKAGSIKVLLGVGCEMMISTLSADSENRIVYGGQIVGYRIAEPWLTAVNNVI